MTCGGCNGPQSPMLGGGCGSNQMFGQNQIARDFNRIQRDQMTGNFRDLGRAERKLFKLIN